MPKVIRETLKKGCGVSLKKIYSNEYSGGSTMVVTLAKHYNGSFKTKLQKAGLSIDWVMDDPLSVKLFRQSSLAEGGADAIHEAGRKYANLLKKRLETAAILQLRRFAIAELAHAKTQIKSGVHVPLTSEKVVFKKHDHARNCGYWPSDRGWYWD